MDKSFTKGKYTCVAFIEIEETGEEIARESAVVEVVDVFGEDHVINEVLNLGFDIDILWTSGLWK